MLAEIIEGGQHLVIGPMADLLQPSGGVIAVVGRLAVGAAQFGQAGVGVGVNIAAAVSTGR